MNTMSFLAIGDRQHVFIDNGHIGSIRKTESGRHVFTQGKKRKPMFGNELRALAAKIELLDAA